MAMHSSSFPPNVPLNLAAHLGPAMVPIPKNVELAMRTIVTQAEYLASEGALRPADVSVLGTFLNTAVRQSLVANSAIQKAAMSAASNTWQPAPATPFAPVVPFTPAHTPATPVFRPIRVAPTNKLGSPSLNRSTVVATKAKATRAVTSKAVTTKTVTNNAMTTKTFTTEAVTAKDGDPLHIFMERAKVGGIRVSPTKDDVVVKKEELPSADPTPAPAPPVEDLAVKAPEFEVTCDQPVTSTAAAVVETIINDLRGDSEHGTKIKVEPGAVDCMAVTTTSHDANTSASVSFRPPSPAKEQPQRVYIFCDDADLIALGDDDEPEKGRQLHIDGGKNTVWQAASLGKPEVAKENKPPAPSTQVDDIDQLLQGMKSFNVGAYGPAKRRG